MNKIFNYSVVTEEEKGEGESKEIVKIVKKAGVFVDEITNYLVNNDTLYLFMKRDIEELRPVGVPVKLKKPSKDFPSGWMKETQMRNVKEPFTVIVEQKEDVDRFLKYTEENGI